MSEELFMDETYGIRKKKFNRSRIGEIIFVLYLIPFSLFSIILGYVFMFIEGNFISLWDSLPIIAAYAIAWVLLCLMYKVDPKVKVADIFISFLLVVIFLAPLWFTARILFFFGIF